MNHPVSYGAYTLYQSSYQRGGERLVSILSVSWDPGKPVVFAGYIGLMIGMLLVLIRKISPNKTQRNQK
jgi:cytochrome c biogenesis protein ResB